MQILQSDALLLDQTTNDLCLDANANIACATNPYSIAQNVASVLKTNTGECWYNSLEGIPYLAQILGKGFNASQIQEYFVTAALTVPGVVSAQCTIQSFDNRTLVGQLQFTDDNSNTTIVTL